MSHFDTPFLKLFFKSLKQSLKQGATRTILVAVLCAHSCVNSKAAWAQQAPFSFHMPAEPHSLDPALLSTNDASYLFANLYRGLYKFHAEKGLLPDGASKCSWQKPLLLVCELRKDRLWSDGKPVLAEDYTRAFQHLLGPKSKSLGVELLRHLLNATEVHTGKVPAQSLGVKALDKHKLQFEFKQADPDFLYKLTSSILSPIRREIFSETFPNRSKANEIPVNGPYKVESWQIGKKMKLVPNEHFKDGNPARPAVEVYFVDEDQTALNLYNQGTLKFLRRLPSLYIDTFKNKPEFKQVPIARFDYLGFGTDLQAYPEFRKALSLSLDFRELKHLLQALGIPGCPSIPEEWMDKTRCLNFDLKAAQAALSKVPEEVRKRRLQLAFSKLGGDDIKKQAEWFQAQWTRHLGLTVDLAQTEQGVYLQLLRTNPPPVFRKGVGLERPTCLSALETFAKDGAENFLKLDLPAYEALLKKLAISREEKERKKLCGEGVKALLDQNLLIPLGRIHFSMLADPKYTGWRLNEMNQLDLADLAGPK